MCGVCSRFATRVGAMPVGAARGDASWVGAMRVGALRALCTWVPSVPCAVRCLCGRVCERANPHLSNH